MVQTCDSASLAKVFKTHAVPQGVCENWINAPKLLANQQKDGDSPIQSIVTGLIERKQKRHYGAPEKLYKSGQSFVLWKWAICREGTRSIELRRPKFEEVVPRGVDQGRSQGIDAQNRRSWLQKKACINVDHIAEDRWGPPLVDPDWHAFCQAIYKGIEGRDW